MQFEEFDYLSVENPVNNVSSPIHKNPSNFADFYDIPEHYFNGIENAYHGINPELDPSKPTILQFIGISGAGKDYTVNTAIENGLPLEWIKTATTRHRRYEFMPEIIKNEQSDIIDRLSSLRNREQYDEYLEFLHNQGFVIAEPADSYTWMRLQNELESEAEYYRALIAEYELIESDAHNHAFYGLPNLNIKEILQNSQKIPFIRTEINGAMALTEILKREGYNTVTFAIMPDSLEQADNAVRQREKPDKVERRLSESRIHLEKFPLATNFYIRNTRQSKFENGVEITGDQRTLRTLTSLLEYLSLI